VRTCIPDREADSVVREIGGDGLVKLHSRFRGFRTSRFILFGAAEIIAAGTGGEGVAPHERGFKLSGPDSAHVCELREHERFRVNLAK